MEWKYLLVLLLGITGFMLAAVSAWRLIAWKPVKFLIHLGFCFVTGMVVLVLLNFCLGHTGLHLAVNPFTAFTVGALHVPGIILLVVLNYLFV